MRRVAKGVVVIVTFDTHAISNFWLYDYAPEIVKMDIKRFPTIQFITETLGGKSNVQQVHLPFDCADGIQEGFYARPEAFLNEEVRKSQSTWKILPEGTEERVITALTRDLETGEWDKKYGKFRKMPKYPSALRIITAYP